MSKLLELDLIEQEIDEGINYPLIPKNYDGEICPYYFNRNCENLLKYGMEKFGEDRVYEGSLKYCLTEFENCLVYKVLGFQEIIDKFRRKKCQKK